MTEDYIQIMIESLEKKNHVLDKVMELDKKQLEIAMRSPFDMEAYDKTMQEKGNLIEQLEKLDDGFTQTYERIRDEVQTNPERYKEQVLEMQELIRTAIDKGVSVEAQEQRNKQVVERAIQGKRREIKAMKVSNAAAAKYYKAMSKINDVDPQLMDRKK